MNYYIYLIQSVNKPEISYVGYTTNINQRLKTHDSGGSIYTKSNRPWKLIVCIAFKSMKCAKEFEKYLK